MCETEMFVPITVDSKLKKMLQEAKSNHRGFESVRYVDRGGTTFERMVQTNYPCAPGQIASHAPLGNQDLA